MKKARKDILGLSQTEFARDLGVTRQLVSLMERGESPIEKRTELAIRWLCLKGWSVELPYEDQKEFDL